MWWGFQISKSKFKTNIISKNFVLIKKHICMGFPSTQIYFLALYPETSVFYVSTLALQGTIYEIQY